MACTNMKFFLTRTKSVSIFETARISTVEYLTQNLVQTLANWNNTVRPM